MSDRTARKTSTQKRSPLGVGRLQSATKGDRPFNPNSLACKSPTPDALVKITGVKLGIKPLLQMLVFLSDFPLHDAPMVTDYFQNLEAGISTCRAGISTCRAGISTCRAGISTCPTTSSTRPTISSTIAGVRNRSRSSRLIALKRS